jgi:hypothetical protein
MRGSRPESCVDEFAIRRELPQSSREHLSGKLKAEAKERELYLFCNL